MISRRNYFTITVIMGVVFFLFQFINVALESWNRYEINPYVVDKKTLLDGKAAYEMQQDPKGEIRPGATACLRGRVLYIGDEKDSIGNVVRAWAFYTRRELVNQQRIQDYGATKEMEGVSLPEVIVCNTQYIRWEESEELDRLAEYVQQGVNLIFAGLPEVSVMQSSPALLDFFGIREVRAREITVAGVHLYKGFLLGGEVIYLTEDEEEYERRQDMEITFPWYILGTGTKAYMKGVPKEKDVKPEDCPGILWRKTFEKAGSGCVFVVNGDYMEDATGLGLLSAMVAETKYYEIYPVVNAQNFIVANYPGLADENEKEMERLYGQSMEGVFRDVIWPGLISVYQRSNLGLSCMLTPQFDYQDEQRPEKEALIHYMKLLNEQRAEVGLSGMSVSNTSIEQKLKEDNAFMQEALPDYHFASLYMGDYASEETALVLRQGEGLDSVRTVVTDYTDDREIIGFCTENVTKQSALTDGFEHTYREDFRLRSVETALGYSSVLIDMNKVAYSGPGEDTWKDISYNLGWNIQYHWKPFQSFEGTTVSQCDERIRRFFSMKYKASRQYSTIYLDISGLQDEAWFILRTKDEAIEEMEGGSWQRLEENVYLLTVVSETVSLKMKPDKFIYKF